MKRRKRIRVEEEVLIRWHENGQDIQRREIRVRYVKPPTIPEVPDRKLHFSLVPCPLWKLNLRAFIKKAQWDNLREHIIDIRGPRCETCGAKEYDGLHAHEEWHYDTDGVPGLAHLMGIGIQCKRCHQAEHYGLTQMFHMQGHISDEELEEIHQHYCTVNGVSRAVMKADHDAERERWVALNKFPWEVVWGPFAAMESEVKSVTSTSRFIPSMRTPSPPSRPRTMVPYPRLVYQDPLAREQIVTGRSPWLNRSRPSASMMIAR
jgi:hypothetical protein